MKTAMSDYFSDREQGPRPRTEEIIVPKVWAGIVALTYSLFDSGAFGSRYPIKCWETTQTIGNDASQFAMAVQAEISEIVWPPTRVENPAAGDLSGAPYLTPSTMSILDFIEFLHRVIAKPNIIYHHGSLQHDHLSFDEAKGRNEFRDDINRIFSRNKLAFELRADGKIVRLAPAVLRESLTAARFYTGETTLDNMLEDSRAKFLNPSVIVRREAVERLWDCWERLKSLDQPNNKKLSVESLLSRASPEDAFRNELDSEASALTRIGNNFHIRHTETSKPAVTDAAQLDYLFHRLFALITLVLSKRGGGT